MKITKLQGSIFCGIILGWIELIVGLSSHAFYTLGVMILIVLIGIMEYTKLK